MDVINAENNAALKIANSALNGKISTFVDQKRQELLDIIATISVNIDYPEYDDVEQLTNEDILPKLKIIKLELEDVLNLLEATNFSQIAMVDTALTYVKMFARNDKVLSRKEGIIMILLFCLYYGYMLIF